MTAQTTPPRRTNPTQPPCLAAYRRSLLPHIPDAPTPPQCPRIPRERAYEPAKNQWQETQTSCCAQSLAPCQSPPAQMSPAQRVDLVLPSGSPPHVDDQCCQSQRPTPRRDETFLPLAQRCRLANQEQPACTAHPQPRHATFPRVAQRDHGGPPPVACGCAIPSVYQSPRVQVQEHR